MVFRMLVQSNNANGETYYVGDAAGWGFRVVGWEDGKNFKAGDVLVFRYDPRVHNVLVTDEAGYTSCVPPSAQKYDSGNDAITLGSGDFFFICGVPGHCEIGMRIAIHAV
ncbi:Basic blue protein [Abeliophyllum distichum]|uniref:Basic blue protein n=1 Tax=Abeliophyllum distichum TaxID=126358 RepID=A0ABD1Q3G5_9LAMI